MSVHQDVSARLQDFSTWNCSANLLWRRVDSVTSKEQAAQKYASKYRKEIADVHGHYGQHAAETLVRCSSSNRMRHDLQQISDTSDHSIERRPRHIRTDPPRPVDPFPVAGFLVIIARDYDRRSLEVNGPPSMLLHGPIGVKGAENCGQDDDEDAGSRVLAGG